MPNPNEKRDQDLEDEDTVGVHAPDLSEDSEDAAKGDDSVEIDDGENMGEDDLDDGVLDDDKGVGG